MAIELTAEQQEIRAAGMQVFGIRILADKVERAVMNTHRAIRGSTVSWRSSILKSTSKAKPDLELAVIIKSIREQIASATGGAYSKVKALTGAEQNACENYLGYPEGFLSVSFLVIDDIAAAATAMDTTTTQEELIATVDLIEAEISGEPSL